MNKGGIKTNNKFSIKLICIFFILLISIPNILAEVPNDKYDIFNEKSQVELSVDSMRIPLGGFDWSYIKIRYAEDIVIVGINLSWDPSVIKLVSIDSSSSPFDLIQNDTNNNIGFMRMYAYEFSEIGLSGNLTMCGLKFAPAENAVENDWCDVIFIAHTIWNSDLYVVPATSYDATATIHEIQMDINQSEFNRGFPIRNTEFGNWAGAQTFTPTLTALSSVDIYIRKFGFPEYDLTVEIHENNPNGPLLDILTIPSEDLSGNWQWVPLDFDDISFKTDMIYCIKLPSPPYITRTSFGYEWGYSFENQYIDGAFWFTRDGGELWRELTEKYDFMFITYGYYSHHS